MNRVNDTTQNVEVNKGEIKKLRTIKLSMDVNDYDTGEYTYSKVFAVEGVPPAADWVVKKKLHKILDNLATHGIGEPGLLAGYSECKEGFIENFRIVDVRTLVDGENPLFEYELNIIRVVSYLELGEKAVICCRAGVSRSNAIALGVLAYYFKIDFNEALELITSKVPICNILLPHFSALYKLLNVRDRTIISCHAFQRNTT